MMGCQSFSAHQYINDILYLSHRNIDISYRNLDLSHKNSDNYDKVVTPLKCNRD